MYGIFKVKETAFKDYIRYDKNDEDAHKKYLLVIFTPTLPLLFDIFMPFLITKSIMK